MSDDPSLKATSPDHTREYPDRRAGLAFLPRTASPIRISIGAYWQTLRLFGRDLRLFLLMSVLAAFAWDGMRMVLFNLYLLRLGYGPAFVGVVTAVGALSFALTCPLAGVLGTRWSSRRSVLWGLGLAAAGIALLPLAEFVPAGWQRGWLLLTIVLNYLGLALYMVNGLPFMMGATEPQERTVAFSVHVALLPLAAFFGSLVSGALPGILAGLLGTSVADPAVYRLPLWMVALLFVAGLLAMLPTREVEQRGAQAPVTDAGPAPVAIMLAIALVMGLRFGGRGTVLTFFNVYLDDGLGLSPALIGALLAAGQLAAIPAALLTPLFVARKGNRWTLLWGMIAMVVATLPLALVPRWPAAGLGFVASSVFFSMTVGPIRMYSQELVRPHWRATMAAAFMMGASLSYSAVSYAGGQIIADLGYQAVFLLGIGMVAVAAFFFGVYFRKPRGEAD